MADYAIPKSGAAYILYTGLIDQSDTKKLKANPTIAAGDFKVSIDGGAFANLTTLPTVTPASGTAVKISLSGAEMSGDNVVVACIDAAGAEWCDQFINIQTSPRGVADLAYPATSGRSMVVDAAGLVDANAVKVGPTGSGTAQTASDLGTGLAALTTTVGVAGLGLSAIPKTGFKLASDGLDSIAVTDPGAPASHTTITKMIVAVWRALWKKETMTATQYKRYADNGSTVNATSTVSDDGTTQTKGDFS